MSSYLLRCLLSDRATGVALRGIAQSELDRLAATWSVLDRARPRRLDDVPAALRALELWIAVAIHLNGILEWALGLRYLDACANELGGQALVGLHHPAHIHQCGHGLDCLVLVQGGGEAAAPNADRYWDLFWRPCDGMPALAPPLHCAHRAAAYEARLAHRPAREAAADITVFLSRAALPLARSRNWPAVS